MFHGLAAGWADLVLPGTSYLERDGTYVNMEGRLQRLRRTVEPPCPDELEWISQLAARLGVDVAPYAAAVFAEVSDKVYGGLPFGEVGERAALRSYSEAPAHTDAPALPEPTEPRGDGLKLVCFKPLFSGPAVERVPELRFQRPEHVVELAPEDANVRGIGSGDVVRVSSNGTSVELRARVNKRLLAGVVRAASEHVAGLQTGVEVTKL
jgi:predicted molibdopterin-dependent oxidoreductase YjgC